MLAIQTSSTMTTPSHWPLFRRHLLAELALRCALPDDVARFVYALYVRSLTESNTYEQVLEAIVRGVNSNWHGSFHLELGRTPRGAPFKLHVHQIRGGDQWYVLPVERALHYNKE